MLEDLEEKVHYNKKPLSITTQVAKLKRRGLIINDEKLAGEYLSNISYYRLRAYTFPYQDNTDPDADHAFVRSNIHFKDIIDLYCFDRRLRSLIFNAIEKIEVALRTKIIQTYCETTNSGYWYEDESLFKNDTRIIYNKDPKTGEISQEEIYKYNELIDEIIREISRSDEDFIKHYKTKYSDPEDPPAWMALEVISMGTLSRLYELLNKDDNKKAIAKLLGLNKIDILENWMHAISNLRNCCAHHNRVWNRRFIVGINIPYNTDRLFLDRETINKIHRNKLFAYLCCIKYILDIISPNNSFHKNLKDLIADSGRLMSLKDMGFPENWNNIGIWKP